MYEKENSKKVRSLRGQAAMEYLMTYGWAILIIVVVLAILAFYLPQLLKPAETCIFLQQDFTCMQENIPPSIYSSKTDGSIKITFRLGNQAGQAVVIKSVVCTNMPTGDITKDYIRQGQLSSPAQVNSGATKQFTLGCFDRSGRPLYLSPGSSFMGSIAIEYNYLNDLEGAPTRTAIATVSGPVVEE
ncbi:MAG: hypothetical protein QXT45_06385 [Candidatus Bilamarchaeaceae archaeon]